jgi:hypothetical protein
LSGSLEATRSHVSVSFDLGNRIASRHNSGQGSSSPPLPKIVRIAGSLNVSSLALRYDTGYLVDGEDAILNTGLDDVPQSNSG